MRFQNRQRAFAVLACAVCLTAAGSRAMGAPPDRQGGGWNGWRPPEEIRLTPPAPAPAVFDLLTRFFSAEGLMGAAEHKAERLLGLDRVELSRQEVRLQKEYGGRYLTLTYGGVGGAPEGGVQAEYPLFGPWALRSETRERGESFLELRHEIKFW